MDIARQNDTVLLLSPDGKRFMIRLTPGQELHTHCGLIRHDDLIDHPLGRPVASHLGHPFVPLRPSTYDLIMHVRRSTQIVYPKEAGYILLRLDVRAGSQVVEGGTGSGALTLALARAVQPSGHVYSYETRLDMLELATRNLNRAGLTDFVELKQRDIAAGFDEREVDAIFLDVREPWRYLDQVKETLKDGGCFGAILVTTNQVSDLLAAMTSHHPTVHPNRAWVTADQMQSGGFVEVEACEILLRSYKPVPERLRPVDRMVAHTGYLVFARKIGSDGLSILESESQQAQPTDELLPMMEPQEISDESATGGNDV